MTLEGISERPDASVPIDQGKSNPKSAWSSTKLFAFRFAFAISALSTFFMIGYLKDFVPPGKKRELVGAVVDHWDWYFRTIASIGAFMIRTVTGGKWSIHDLVANYYFNYTPMLCLSFLLGHFILAVLIAIPWSLLDRHRGNYARLNAAMRVYTRYAIALSMLGFAMAKVIPNQFGTMTAARMLRPFGQYAHTGVLWTFMAASPGYTIFAGLVELTGSVLLFFRRTTLLGGLILAGALTNVEALDLGYRLGAGGDDAALLLMLDLIVLAPYLPGLFSVLLGTGQSRLPHEPLPVRQRWYHSVPAKATLLCLALLPFLYNGSRVWRAQHRVGQVWGLYDVVTFMRNGRTVIAQASDGSTWWRVAGEAQWGAPKKTLWVQYANGEMSRSPLFDDVGRSVWTSPPNSKPVTKLNYVVQTDGDVALDGSIGTDTVHLLLHPVDMKKAFILLSR